MAQGRPYEDTIFHPFVFTTAFRFRGDLASSRGKAAHVATCAILTCAPNQLMASIHDRMPVILPRSVRARWLDRATGRDELQSLLTPFPPEEMEAYPVSTLVNSPRNDTPACIAPLVACR